MFDPRRERQQRHLSLDLGRSIFRTLGTMISAADASTGQSVTDTALPEIHASTALTATAAINS